MADALLKDLFTGFAAEEKEHETTLRGFWSAIPENLPFDESRDYKVSQTVGRPLVSTDMRPADAFALAAKNEETAMNHYTNLADGCTDPIQKRIFMDLAAMERDHKFKMERAFVDIGYPVPHRISGQRTKNRHFRLGSAKIPERNGHAQKKTNRTRQIR
jgi:hypothetical protein